MKIKKKYKKYTKKNVIKMHLGFLFVKKKKFKNNYKHIY